MPSRRLDVSSVSDFKFATERLAEILYQEKVVITGIVTEKTPRLTERNLLIIERHFQGYPISELSRDYGITPQRVWQIIHEN